MPRFLAVMWGPAKDDSRSWSEGRRRLSDPPNPSSNTWAQPSSTTGILGLDNGPN